EPELSPILQRSANDERQRKRFDIIKRVALGVPAVKIDEAQRESPFLRFVQTSYRHEANDGKDTRLPVWTSLEEDTQNGSEHAKREKKGDDLIDFLQIQTVLNLAEHPRCHNRAFLQFSLALWLEEETSARLMGNSLRCRLNVCREKN